MTKADLAERIYDRLGGTHRVAADLAEMVFTILRDTLATGEKIKIAGFGNFVIKEKTARRGRNPQTSESITIEARRILTFKPSQMLREAINQTGTETTTKRRR